MTKTVLLLGRTGIVIQDVERQLHVPDIHLVGGTGLDDAQAALARTAVDHVIMGAGIDLETRLALIREIFQQSDHTTVHLKDKASGPGGFLPFVQAVLQGIQAYPGSLS